MRGGTQWHALSAADVQLQASVRHVHVVHTRIVLVHLGRGSVTTTARQPCCDVPGEPVVLARDQTNEVGM